MDRDPNALGYDLSYWMDPEPVEMKYGDKVYKTSFDQPPVLHERIAIWVRDLAGMDDDTAETLSVQLTAEAYHIDIAEARTIKPMARKVMLGFLVTGRRTDQATTQ